MQPLEPRDGPVGVRSPATTNPTCDLRSLFFVRPERLERKLPEMQARSLVIDIEDGVSSVQKPVRRQRIAELLQTDALDGRSVLLRVNAIQHADLVELDLRTCLKPGVHGLILPMLRSAGDVALFEAFVAAAEKVAGIPVGQTAFYPLLEQAAGVLDAARIAEASPRIRALCFGHADFLSSLGGFPKAGAAEPAMSHVVLAAGAAGLPAIASPFLDIANLRGFRNYCVRMRDRGFTGAFSLHPKQDEVARTVFSVTALEAHRARSVLSEVYPARAFGKVAGEMVGPPMAARAVRILADQPRHDAPVQAPVVGRVPRYGLDLETVRVGQVLVSPHELTIDDSWRTTWMASFPTSNRVVTSSPYAASWGLPGRALPTSLLLNLTLCLSVEPFSQSCRLHLGLHDAVQLAPAAAGDTFRNFIRVESMRNTSRGDASVIESTHILVNQHGVCVYRLTKMSYYDPLPGPLPREDATPDPALAAMFAEAPSGGLSDVLSRAGGPAPAVGASLAAGEVILHPAVRPIGWSENLLLTTLVRNTHPVHFDSEQFPRDEIIVCGGFVQSMAFALAAPELRQVLTERLEHSSHVNTVAPEDRIGAISRVLAIRELSPVLEEVHVKTLGLRNVNVVAELTGLEMPARLFDPAPRKPSELEAICRAECPELEGRIALQASRRLLRAKVSA